MRFIRYLFICWLFLFACMHVCAQEQTRGFGTVTPPAASKAGRTVALVVGVSDYPFVTPLNYAAEDALLMYDFLQSNAGGNVSPADIRLLVNEEATLQNVWGRGLSWIENTVKPAQGDRVIIYLAGHGDAISSDESFFLCYNANPAGDKNNYHVSGALNVSILKNRIAKFSAAGAEVVLIMDACRSGDLPGVRAGISNPFESVVERKAGETLMLSAGANQLAVEDRRWGRGHGIFTWYLVQGLSGKADENADGTVDFYELEQYTKTKVRKETQSMGRMQVPQFAASPAGMGWQGKADKKFLSKLETESLSAVNVSESIALARSTAESSWFTDSTLYAGFNELKKLVRAGKYLGEGSAEPMYTQLAAQFSADQLEPVRVYYMSALAGAGFEAINQELMLEIGSTYTTKFYERRLNYLSKAAQLQRKPGEVDKLESYRKLVEAIYLQKNSRDHNNWQMQFTKGMVDSLSALRLEFYESAAYYYWMRTLSMNPWSSIQLIARNEEDLPNLAANSNRLMDSLLKFAPDWPKLIEGLLVELKTQYCTVEYGDRLNKLVRADSMNAEYWYLLSIYYKKHKPYDVLRSYRCLLKSCELHPNIKSASTLFALANIGGAGLKSLEVWQICEALRNHYHYQFTEHDWQKLKHIASRLINQKSTDELTFDRGINLGFQDFIEYGLEHSKNKELLELFSSAESLDIPSYQAEVLSALAVSNQDYTHFSVKLDSLVIGLIKEPKWRTFDDPKLECIARRIRVMRRYPSLRFSLPAEQRKLNDLITQLASNEIKDQYLQFYATEYLNDKTLKLSDYFVDSLLQLCHRNPTQDNFWKYWRVIEVSKMQNRVVDLFADSTFRSCVFRDLNKEVDSTFHFQVEASVYTIQRDSMSLISLMNNCLNSTQNSFYRIMYYFDAETKSLILRNVDILEDTTISGFKFLIEYGRYQDALRLYELRGDALSKDSNWQYLFRINTIKLFNCLGDFDSAADEMEVLVDLVSGMSGYYGTSQPYSELFGPYDTFTQSKEYKAMMARVYTSPEK